MIPEVHACSGYLAITAPNGRIATTPEPWLKITYSGWRATLGRGRYETC